MKKNDGWMLAAAALISCAAFVRPVRADDPQEQPPASAPAQPQANAPAPASESAPRDAGSVIDSWPDKTKSAAKAMIEKYGPPDGVSGKMLAWNDKDQWTTVAIYRDAIAHEVPTPHEDFVENKISYKVPENKVGELAHFDPDLVVDRARGTLAAHSDSEQHNVLALNLAHEIVIGKRSVASAMSFQKKTLAESEAGKSSPYVESLMFKPSAQSSQGMQPSQGMPEEQQP